MHRRSDTGRPRAAIAGSAVNAPDTLAHAAKPASCGLHAAATWGTVVDSEMDFGTCAVR